MPTISTFYGVLIRMFFTITRRHIFTPVEQVFIDSGAVAWPGEIDLAPDAMHAEISSRLTAP